jgi:hypothetical protein
MRGFWLGLFLSLLLLGLSESKESGLREIDNYFIAWDKYLSDHISPKGLMLYEKAQTQSSMAELSKMLDFLKNFSPLRLKGAEKKAFWINTYNLYVHFRVLKHLNGKKPQPTDSVQKIDSIWTEKFCHFLGFSLSLNEIEKTVLLEHFNDSAIHFGLVCASKGCPKLWRAFFPKTVDEVLIELGKKFIRETTVINEDREVIQLSRIFKWYQHHFVDSEGLLSGLRKYFPEEIKNLKIDSQWQIEWNEYDWGLNAEF